MEIVVFGETKKPRMEIEKIIQKMGGTVRYTVDETVTVIISSTKYINMVDKHIKKAKEFGIQIVSEDFLDEVQNKDAVALMVEKNLCSWGIDVSKLQIDSYLISGMQIIINIFLLQPNIRISLHNKKMPSSSSLYTIPLPKSQKMTLKSKL